MMDNRSFNPRRRLRLDALRRSILVGVVLMGLSAFGMPAASAATKSPGLLQTTDLPGSFQQSSGPIAYATPTALVVTPSACTETTRFAAAALGGVEIVFARTGATPGSIALIESVISFRSAKAAAKDFALDAKSHKARMKCGTLGFIPPGSATVGGSTTYQTAKFPKIGSGVYYESSGVPGTASTNTAVTFVSGPYIVRLGTFGGTNPLTVTDLKTIAPRALKRLPIPTPIPPTTLAR